MVEKEYVFKLSTDDAQANVDELNQSLKLQEQLIEDIEKEVRDYEKQIDKTSKKDLAQRKDLNDKIKQTKERLKDEKIALKDLNKDRKNANETLKESTENAKDYSGVLGIIDQKTGGAISGFTNLTKSVGGATKGFNLMRIAIIGTGIGALLIAVTSLSAAFTSSEEGQNKFAKLMGVIGSVVDNVTTLLSDLGLKIISVFEDPKQAIIDFKDFIVQNITNRITSLIDTFGFLGSAIKKVFQRDFAGAMEDAKKAGSAYIDTMTGVKDTINKTKDAVGGLTDELIREGNIAAQIADKRAKAVKLERDLITERSKANRDRADLLNKAVDKENFKLEERIGFLKEAGKIEDDITNKELAAAKLRLDAKVLENEQANSTTEDLNEEAQLRANLIDLETAKLRKAKLVTTQISALNSEARSKDAAEQKVIDDEAALKKKEKDDADKLTADEKKKKKEEDDADALVKENKRLADIKAITDKYKLEEENTELEQLVIDEEKRLKELELLKATEEEKAQVRAFYADKTKKVKEKNAKEEKALERSVLNAKLGIAKQGFDLLADIAGKDSKVGKAMAIASATISGTQGVINAFATASDSPITKAFPAYPFIQAGLAGAFALKNIASIKSVDPTGRGSSGSVPSTSGGGGGGAPSIPQAPSFNVVGDSGTNQLADAIGGQEQKPVQAFVVASEVSTAQELDRNIIEGASIG